MNREEAFTSIYREQAWGSGVSRSGPGSDPEITRPYVSFVREALDRLDVASVLDLGHGDWLMWPSDSFSDVNYYGVDVAQDLSDQVSKTFGSSTRRFSRADAVTMTFPQVDLVLCKDVLMHLPNGDVRQVLTKFKSARYAIVCHDVLPSQRGFTAVFKQLKAQAAPRYRFHLLKSRSRFWVRFMKSNVDIVPGGYRPLDLSANPWDLRALGLEVVQSMDIDSNNPWPGVKKRIWLLRPA